MPGERKRIGEVLRAVRCGVLGPVPMDKQDGRMTSGRGRCDQRASVARQMAAYVISRTVSRGRPVGRWRSKLSLEAAGRTPRPTGRFKQRRDRERGVNKHHADLPTRQKRSGPTDVSRRG